MTNKLLSMIQSRIHGRLSRLAVHIVDHRVTVEAYSATYYGVQLAIAALKKFVANFPEMAPARVEFLVGDRELILHYPFAKHVARTDASDRQEPILFQPFVPDWNVRISNRQPRAPKQDQTSTAIESNKHMIAAGV